MNVEEGMGLPELKLLPLTVPEVRKLLWQLVWFKTPEPEAVLEWSWWRRYQQLRARRSHYKRRLALFSS